jgi:16S rRNA (cytosine967-C5)-methyltransferase
MLIAQTMAAQIVARVMGGRTLDHALTRAWAATAGIAATDKALIQELCYGTLRHLGPLRATVKKLLTRPATDLPVETLLWVALYQLRFTGAPPATVVDNAVDAASRLRVSSAKGLVNAVLRFYLRNRPTIEAEPPATDEARWSHPQWWIDVVRKEYPSDWQSILEASNGRPPLTLRVNRRKTVRDGELRVFAAADIACRAIGTDGIVVEDPRNVTALPGFAEGRLSVQDAGAQFAYPFLGVEDGMRVLDACAAPGGKTTHILERVRCDLTALDRDERRLQRIRENLARLGLQCTVRQADAGAVGSWWDGVPFDRVLLDAPCTASGVMRRHPDGKWLRRPGDIAQFAQQQSRLLDALWPVVAPGGRLLYTTCSIFGEENDIRVADFLDRHDDGVRRELDWPTGVRRIGAGQLLPSNGGGEDNHDGFFYAAIEKRGG